MLQSKRGITRARFNNAYHYYYSRRNQAYCLGWFFKIMELDVTDRPEENYLIQRMLGSLTMRRAVRHESLF